jgi:hypothetical protein
MKRLFLQGIIAGILSSIASIIYLKIYQSAFDTHFEAIINLGSIIGACMLGCMLITVGYALLLNLNKQYLKGWLNIAVTLASFASIISPIGMSLPLDLESPELFPGLVVPMHFFPALAFFALEPFFQTQEK